MAINWRPRTKRNKVQRILERHPVESSRCDKAAKSIWPLAKDQDPNAAYWLLLADAGPFLLPKDIPNPQRWLYHVCVDTDMHGVCALTGPDGTPSATYIADKFQYAEAVSKVPIRSTEELVVEIEKVLAA